MVSRQSSWDEVSKVIVITSFSIFFWLELVRFLLLCYLELFFLFFKTFIRWINIGFGFSLKFIFRRCMSIGDSKHFILNESWWKLSQFIIVFFPELYQFFFLFFNILIRWRNLTLGFDLKVIFIRCMFIGDSKHLILKESWWRISQFIMVFFLEILNLYLFLLVFFKWRKLGLDFFPDWSLEYVYSEVILITSFWMCSDKNMSDFSFWSYLKCWRTSSCLKIIINYFSWHLHLVGWWINQ